MPTWIFCSRITRNNTNESPIIACVSPLFEFVFFRVIRGQFSFTLPHIKIFIAKYGNWYYYYQIWWLASLLWSLKPGGGENRCVKKRYHTGENITGKFLERSGKLSETFPLHCSVSGDYEFRNTFSGTRPCCDESLAFSGSERVSAQIWEDSSAKKPGNGSSGKAAVGIAGRSCVSEPQSSLSSVRMELVRV